MKSLTYEQRLAKIREESKEMTDLLDDELERNCPGIANRLSKPYADGRIKVRKRGDHFEILPPLFSKLTSHRDPLK